jgi:hypothetical protein
MRNRSYNLDEMAGTSSWLKSVYQLKLRELRGAAQSEFRAFLGEMRGVNLPGTDLMLLERSAGKLTDGAVARCEAAIPELVQAHIKVGHCDVSTIAERIRTRFVDVLLTGLPAASLYVSVRGGAAALAEGRRLRQYEDARFSARRASVRAAVVHYVVRAVGDVQATPRNSDASIEVDGIRMSRERAHATKMPAASTLESNSQAPSKGLGPFEVALSFPGTVRDRIEPVATLLARRLGRDRVFYDKFYTSLLARPNLDVLLQDIYRRRARLLVVFIGRGYQESEWCGVEWRAIRDIIKSRCDEQVMLVRVDDAPVDGIFSLDGYIELVSTADSELAAHVLERLASLAGTP